LNEFIKKSQKVEVKEYPNQVKNEPLVSVCVQAYQHVNFIKDCLEGILMQKTNFEFEILLRDDASTDGTAEICKDYASKYPDLINLLAYEENQFSQDVRPFIDNVRRARGKYIALCEGDDYWTDPYKLQKQADFLKANPEYGMVYSNVKYVDVVNAEITPSKYHRVRQSALKNGYMFYDYLKGNFSIMTNTVLFRADLIKTLGLIDTKKWFIYDVWLYQRIMMVTKIYKFKKIMGCYIDTSNSVTKNNFI